MLKSKNLIFTSLMKSIEDKKLKMSKWLCAQFGIVFVFVAPFFFFEKNNLNFWFQIGCENELFLNKTQIWSKSIPKEEN